MHRSSRLPGSAAPNALSAALARRRAAGAPILDLTASNPTACGFDYPKAAIRSALGAETVLAYAPDARGALRTREAVAAHHGHGVRPDDLLLTASTSEAYALLFKLLGDPGDEVIVPSPSYPLFEWLARLEGLAAKPAPARLDGGRWTLDEAGLESVLTPRSRAVCAVNPNNPTGQHFSQTEWRMLAAFCARNGLALIVDEVFADFPLEPEADRLATALEIQDPPCPVFVLSGLSKTALLPQVKLGWIIARGPRAAASLEDLEFLADQYLSLSASAQAAGPELLALAPSLRAQASVRCRANLAALDRWLEGHPACSRLPVGGGWSVLLRRPATEPDEAFALRLIEEEGVLVHPGHFFDLPMEGFCVLSLITRPAGFGAGLEGLSRALAIR